MPLVLIPYNLYVELPNIGYMQNAGVKLALEYDTAIHCNYSEFDRCELPIAARLRDVTKL
jgi:hypothetical protein